jgi:quercetin dioxygenase-like cupin family protein
MQQSFEILVVAPGTRNGFNALIAAARRIRRRSHRMKRPAFVVHPADYPRSLNVVGERITVLASGAATGGYELFLQEGPEGSGPPPHHHPWDESFYVTRGEVAFGLDGEEHVARAGTLVHLPAGTVHWFRFGKEGGQMVSVTSREAASAMFEHIDREISPASPDLPRLVAIAGEHRTEIAAP